MKRLGNAMALSNHQSFPPCGQQVCFLGRRTLSKLYLMLHFGRMLGQCGPVRLDTVNPLAQSERGYGYNGIDMHEHPDPFSLQQSVSDLWEKAVLGEQEQACPDSGLPVWHFVDSAEGLDISSSCKLVLVMDPDRNSVESGFAALSEMVVKNPELLVHRVYLDLQRYSRIGARYLEGMLMQHMAQAGHLGEWFALEAQERDQGAVLDNQHDDRLRLGRLSPSYHLLLKELAVLLFGLPARESTRLLRIADRATHRRGAAIPSAGR
jgi:hypothetical protein